MSERETSQLQGLEERIQDNAHQLAGGAREYGRAGGDYARRVGHNTAAFVSENALPLCLIGLGAGWLVLSMRKQQVAFDDQEPYHGYDYYGLDESSSAQRGEHALSRAREGSHQVATRVRDGIGSARARAGELAHQVGHRASEWSHEARTQLSDAGQRTMDYADANPLLVGALALAAGVGVGLALPATRRENQWLGKRRDRLLDDARGLIGDARESARETVHEVQRQAHEAKEGLRSAVKESRFPH